MDFDHVDNQTCLFLSCTTDPSGVIPATRDTDVTRAGDDVTAAPGDDVTAAPGGDVTGPGVGQTPPGREPGGKDTGQSQGAG